MQIKRYDYENQFGDRLPTLIQDIERMLRQGKYVLTQEVQDFEEMFGKYLDVSHVCGLNSGTDALVLALRTLGVAPGDEVITQANTFHATVAAICLAGATPVLVDADEERFLIDTEKIAASITSKTRAIMPVHMYGNPTPMKSILKLASEHEIHVVEDAAQAHGAKMDGQRVGTFGEIGCFSFHPSKNLAAAGDGGVLVTQDAQIADEVRKLRNLGQSGQNHHVVIGYNSKLDSIQARILSEKLPQLDTWNTDRRRIASCYQQQLSDLPIRFQQVSPGGEHVYHLFQIRTDRRDELHDYLQSVGVDCIIRYPTPIHLQPAFASYGWKPGQFPVAEILALELLCLPIRPSMPDAEIEYVTEHVRTFFGKGK